jgi:DNA polymerase-1
MPDVDLLIDGDLFLYKAACGVEKEVQWDEVNHLLWSNVDDAWGCLEDRLVSVRMHFDVSIAQMLIATTGRKNFRKDLYPGYKANRIDSRKPLCYGALLERLRNNYNVVEYEGIEADDVLGILATRVSNRKRIIVSDDKDMRSVPATIYTKGETVTISEDEADYNHMYQTLCGDQADGYPGCSGIGPVKAAKLLTGAAHYWPIVVSAFGAAGHSEADALVQARLARILRAEDWNSEKKEPILWSPKSN